MIRLWNDLKSWDSHLSELGGHPLQSSLWGESRRVCGQMESLYATVEHEGRRVLMARVEARPAGPFAKVAWIPKGPVLLANNDSPVGIRELGDLLRKRGYCLMVVNPYAVVQDASPGLETNNIFIDLTADSQTLLANLGKEIRRMVRRATDAGLRVEQTTEKKDVLRFHELCAATSAKKSFPLNCSEDLFLSLLSGADATGPFKADLFIVRRGDTLAAGLFLIRSRFICHNFWSAIDKNIAGASTSPFLHWSAMLWAKAQGCVRYDFEGIDKQHNRGTYEFKRKFGGTEVVLEKPLGYPLTTTGRLVRWSAQFTGRL